MVESRARLTPETNAIIALEYPPLTYLKLIGQINYVVSFFNSIGIGRNDCVATILPNGPEMAVAIVSIASGAILAPLNPAYSIKEFESYFALLKPKAVVVLTGLASNARVAAKGRNISIVEIIPEGEKEAGIFKLAGGMHSNASQPGFSKPDDIALILHTSGTTSQPKKVPLTQKNLLVSARHVQSALNLTDRDISLNIMPLFHIHGIVAGMLSSLTAGGGVVCVPDFDATEFFQWVKICEPTWYTAVPSMHQSILDRAGKNRDIVEQCRIRFIRSSSSSLPSSIMEGLETMFNVPVIEAYGMTEASHQIASNPLPPKVRKTGSVGLAAGPEIKIMSQTEPAFLSENSVGEIVIHGPNVTSGYLENPDANESSYTDIWFRTGDLGYLDEDGYLFITGRIKEMINRGGEKIAPLEVDEALLACPLVAQAVTFAVPHNRLGEEVAAVVVLNENADAGQKEIQAFVASRLGFFKVPKHIIITDHIPKSATGKLQRIGLAKKLGIGKIDETFSPTNQSYIAPRTDIEQQMVNIWASVLKISRDEIGVTHNFFHLGGDSILVARSLARIQETFAITISFLDFFNAPTVAGLSQLISEGASKEPDDELLLKLLSELDGLSDEQAQQLMDKKHVE